MIAGLHVIFITTDSSIITLKKTAVYCESGCMRTKQIISECQELSRGWTGGSKLYMKTSSDNVLDRKKVARGEVKRWSSIHLHTIRNCVRSKVYNLWWPDFLIWISTFWGRRVIFGTTLFHLLIHHLCWPVTMLTAFMTYSNWQTHLRAYMLWETLSKSHLKVHLFPMCKQFVDLLYGWQCNRWLKFINQSSSLKTFTLI